MRKVGFFETFPEDYTQRGARLLEPGPTLVSRSPMRNSPKEEIKKDNGE